MSVPSLGHSLHVLMGNYSFDSAFLEVNPPETYNYLLQQFAYITLITSEPISTEWTRRALSDDSRTVALQKRMKYKTIDRKVRPVPSFMPDPAGQVFKPIIIEPPPALTLNPPLRMAFVPTERLTNECLDIILDSIPNDFLSLREVDLLIEVLQLQEKCLAFVDAERGMFSD